MVDTQALDALAALCGSVTSVPAVGPVTSDPSSDNTSSYAPDLSQPQMQGYQAEVAAVNQAQAQVHAQQQQSTRQQATAMPTLSPGVVEAYNNAVSAAQENHEAPSRSNPSQVSPGLGAGFAAAPSPSSFAARRPSQPQPALNAQAQAIALTFVMAQQQQQQQRQQLQRRRHLQQSLQQPQLQNPQQRYSPPSILINKPSPGPLATRNRLVPAPVAAMQPYPQAPMSSYLPPVTHCPQNANAEIPIPSARQESLHYKTPRSKPSRPLLPVVKKPPPKKRYARSAVGRTGGGLRDPSLKSVLSEWEEKKQAKRAANRLSAHLSRKRKKMLIEDLKFENIELRRKEQILQAIPDLIIVFDSSGRMPFVSASITRFLDHTAEGLADASFWDLLSEDSVQDIKSAFMDALAAKRGPDEDSTPLCGGETMTVELVDRSSGDEGGESVSMKGVVHFAGESPECVCSIRPRSHGGKGRDKTLSPPNVSSLSENSLRSKRKQPRHPSEKYKEVTAAMYSHRISDIDSVERPGVYD